MTGAQIAISAGCDKLSLLAVSPDRTGWIRGRAAFLLPVKALSIVVRRDHAISGDGPCRLHRSARLLCCPPQLPAAPMRPETSPLFRDTCHHRRRCSPAPVHVDEIRRVRPPPRDERAMPTNNGDAPASEHPNGALSATPSPQRSRAGQTARARSTR